jgi:hypothetical protein
MSEDDAIKLLRCAGVFEKKGHLSVSSVARLFDCSSEFVREHLTDFPGHWKMAGGDIRIPIKDVEAFVAAGKVIKP